MFRMSSQVQAKDKEVVPQKGNLYTVETYQGRRVQRLLYKGIAPVRAKQQGVPWPPGK